MILIAINGFVLAGEPRGRIMTMLTKPTYRINRDETEAGIRLLAERYPKTFFAEPKLRRPLVKNIIAQLEQDGAPMARVLIAATVEWYQSHFSYHYALQAGAKRLDLGGNAVATVTEQEAINAQNYIRLRKQEQEKKYLALNVGKVTLPTVLPKEIPMPAAQLVDPLAHLQTLLDGVRNASREQPEALRRPLIAAGLRVVIAEAEKSIQIMESK